MSATTAAVRYWSRLKPTMETFLGEEEDADHPCHNQETPQEGHQSLAERGRNPYQVPEGEKKRGRKNAGEGLGSDETH